MHECGQSVWGTVPSEETLPQIWTLSKTSTHLTLKQNEKLVFSYQFESSASCSKLKGNVVAKMSFNKFSTLSASFKPYSGEETNTSQANRAQQSVNLLTITRSREVRGF